MRKKGVVGIARVVLQKREHILKLEPFGKGLLATTLRYASQVRNEGAVFEDIADVELQDELLELAAHIIEKKTGPFDVGWYEDRDENALIDLIKAKQSGREIQPVETPQPTNVINLIKSRVPESPGTGVKQTPPKRRAAPAAGARDKVRKEVDMKPA
jgi:DNA end-binding protein Ku